MSIRWSGPGPGQAAPAPGGHKPGGNNCGSEESCGAAPDGLKPGKNRNACDRAVLVPRRSLHHDLQICRAAAPGPWCLRKNLLYAHSTGQPLAHIYSQTDGLFIVAARTALPHWAGLVQSWFHVLKDVQTYLQIGEREKALHLVCRALEKLPS